jgi:biopolymer transport protein ExbD
MRRIYRRTRIEEVSLPSITLTPFIDTVLVLLVIFMVTAPGKAPELVPTLEQKPLDKPSDNHKYKALVIFVDAQGKVFIDGAPVSEAHWAQQIATGIQQSPIMTARIHAEPSSPSATLYKVIDIVRRIEGVKIVFW